MTRKKSFGKIHKELALKMVSNGSSYEDVGAEFGVGRDAVYRLVKDRTFTGESVRYKGRKLQARLSKEEERLLLSFKESGNFKTDSDAIRALLRSTKGFLEVSSEAQTVFEGLTRKIEGMATNINQVARAANYKKIDLVRAQWEDVEELRRGLGELTRLVKDALREMRRKNTRLWNKSDHGNG